MDYAIKKSVSISTLRRYIKSNRIKYRTENGKYMLWDDEAGISTSGFQSSAALPPSSASSTNSAENASPQHSRDHFSFASNASSDSYQRPNTGSYSSNAPSFSSVLGYDSSSSQNTLKSILRESQSNENEEKIKQLEYKLQKAQEEIAELKMLVSLYESQPHTRMT